MPSETEHIAVPAIGNTNAMRQGPPIKLQPGQLTAGRLVESGSRSRLEDHVAEKGEREVTEKRCRSLLLAAMSRGPITPARRFTGPLRVRRRKAPGLSLLVPVALPSWYSRLVPTSLASVAQPVNLSPWCVPAFVTPGNLSRCSSASCLSFSFLHVAQRCEILRNSKRVFPTMPSDDRSQDLRYSLASGGLCPH